MSEMRQNESLERVNEGLSRAASCCRELAKMLDAKEWRDMSHQLLVMRQKILKFYKEPPLTEIQVLGLVTQMELAQKLAQHQS